MRRHERLHAAGILAPCRAALGLLAALVAAGAGPAAGPPEVPILLVTIDTLRADHLGCYGDRRAETPRIDRLARDAVRFAAAFTPVPLTLPAHASLLTGTYPAFHGVRDNDGALDRARETLASVLGKSGYATAAFVGSSLLDRPSGLDAGFEHYGEVPGRSDRDLERRAEEVVHDAAAWIAARRSARWLAWVHLFDPHDPYDPPPPYRARFAGRLYDGEIAYTDAALGRLLDELRRAGLYDAALVVVTADHGEGLGEHDEPNHGLFLYDATIRVPLLVKLPGGTRAGETVERPVSLVDLLPTILGLAGVPRPATVQGAALFARGGAERSAPPAEVYGESLYLRRHFGWSEQRSLRTVRYKYIESTRPELYDLESDPRETRDLGPGAAALAEGLRGRLHQSRGYAPVPSAPTARPADRARLERLAALSYVSVAPPARAPGPLPDPKDQRATLRQVLEGMTLLKQGRPAEAVPRFAAVVARDPGLVVAHDFLGNALFRLGRHREAAEAFRAELRLDPESPQARFNLARVLLETGGTAEAIVLLDRLTAAAPGDAGAWRLRGRAHLAAGDPERARGSLERALARDPRSGETEYLLGRAVRALGRRDEAGRRLRRALELDPELVDALLALGEIAVGEQDLAGALDLYSRAVEQAPGNAVALYQKGAVLLSLGRTREARAALGAVLRLDPRSADAHNALGLALSAEGRPAEAITAFREAVRLRAAAPFRRNLGLALMEAGQAREAAEILRALLRDDPGNAELRQRLQEAERRAPGGRRAP